jgi:hypothetical protein
LLQTLDWQERLDRDKRFNLLQKYVNYRRNIFYWTGAWSDCLKQSLSTNLIFFYASSEALNMGPGKLTSRISADFPWQVRLG